MADGTVAFNGFAFGLENVPEEWRDADEILVDCKQLFLCTNSKLSDFATQPNFQSAYHSEHATIVKYLSEPFLRTPDPIGRFTMALTMKMAVDSGDQVTVAGSQKAVIDSSRGCCLKIRA